MYINQTAGYWGQATSTIDWCEENYATTKYVSEFWNSFTNMFFFYFAYHGIKNSLKMGLEIRYVFCYLGMVLVGLGSFMFHMTLKYSWQLADELPMIYCTAVVLYCSYNASNLGKPSTIVPILLFVYSVLVTVTYVYLNIPAFHQVSYALLNFAILYYAYNDQQEIIRRKSRFQSDFNILLINTTFGFIISFFLWNVDNIYCDNLRAMRKVVPPFVAPLLQLHGYWHIGTAFACYNGILHQQLLRIACLGRERDIEIAYFNYVIPYIKFRKAPKL
ncbi:Alkaline ceramidase 3 [Smittium mucronatum]|uniref:Alkaline ceramidase 3 n=1 Tax=Smittium mucronatum TaxID=133383 RepID=A0A1R0GU07_9FUNG|nr:Alkaline ceramidase 3 [Smittium mucronatum]